MRAELLFSVALDALTHDFLRYLIGAGGVYLVINLALARHLAHRKIRADSPAAAQIWREIAVSQRTVLVFAVSGIGITLAAMAGYLPVYREVGVYGWPYLLLSVILSILAHDAYFYWVHFAMHRNRRLGRIHWLHHRSYNPTAFTSYAFHIGEAAIHAAFLPLFLWAVPMHPLAILIFASHMMLRNAIGHCGYELFPARADGRPRFDWLTSVTHHDLHHAQAGYDFGLYFTWWDRIMGTEHPSYHAEFARAAGVSAATASRASAGS